MRDDFAEFHTWLKTDPQARAFTALRDGKRVPPTLMLSLGIRALFLDPCLWLLRNYPGGIGIKLREWWYRPRMKSMGRCVMIDEGVRIDGAHNMSVSDYVWIDKHVQLFAPWGSISIGRRVHIAEHVLISGGGHVTIGDYAAIARGASLYSHSEAIVGGRRMSGPMIPEEQKGMKSAPIVIGKDALIGINAVIFPGVTIGEGAIVGANAVVNRHVAAWDIVYGAPAKRVAVRPKVTVNDI